MNLSDLMFLIIMMAIFGILLTIVIIWLLKLAGIDFSNKKKSKQDFSKNKSEGIKFDDLGHQTEEYRLYEIKTKIDQNTKYIPINIPTMCPICGRPYITGYFECKIKHKEDIKISLCENHYRISGKKPSFINNNIDKILIFSLIITSISGIFIYILTQNLNIFTIILIVNGIPLFLYLPKKIIEMSIYYRNLGKLYDHVRFGFSKDSIMIRIKNPDWESEFKRLNDWKKIPYKFKEIKEHRKMGLKWTTAFILCIIISIPVTIISSIFFPTYARLIIYFIVLIPLFFIVFMLIYHISEEQVLKITGSQSGRLVMLIIYFILILLLTLEFFEVFQIFG